MSIYLDNAAATPLDPKIKKEVEKYEKLYANPSSIHRAGEEANKILESSRSKVATILKVKTDEIIFTSSGTESVNLALFGVARANPIPSRLGGSYGASKKNKGHIVTSNIEHHAVLNSCKQLEREGFKITYVKADKNGIIQPEEVKKAIRKDTLLVSIMHANNEIGTVQPIRKIRKAIGEEVFFHTDACQSASTLNIRPNDLKVDLLTMNGSKIYGPKGVGVLFKKRKVKMEPILFGGSQERGLRAGTENISAIVGLAKALEISDSKKERENKRLIKLRDYCLERVLNEINDSKLNGHASRRLPNNINISFKNVDGEMLMMYLSEKEIFVSTGSACTVDETGPSHVMMAISNPKGWGNIRMTLGHQTKKTDIDKFISVLKKSVERIRNF